MKVLILGAGKMVEALLEGLKTEADLSHYYLYSPSGKSAQTLASKVGANFVANPTDVKDPDYVWVGCKPQQLTDLGKSIHGLFGQATFVSMLAAISEETQMQILGAQYLVRIMPNLAVKQKTGVTLISSSSATAKLPHLNSLFSLVGKSLVMKEEELEELTLLTGSGPALFYEFAKNLAGSFTSLDSVQREELARMVVRGAGVSVSMNPNSLQTMIDEVTSKAGVTIAVLEEWRRLGLGGEMKKGIEAGKKRSAEIKQTILRN